MLTNTHEKPTTFCLDNFEGPLEFLLYLVQRKEIDISEVVLRQIMEQYLAELEEHHDIEVGAEFVGTAATLLLLKSRHLLPRQPRDPDEEQIDPLEDPRFEVIHQLLDYSRFRDAAKELSRREEGDANLFPRGTDVSPPTPEPRLGIEHLSLEDLANYLAKAIEQSTHREGTVKGEIWKVADKIKFLRHELSAHNSPTFEQLFSPKKHRNELIVTFLAILELMKLQELSVIRQDGVIRITTHQPQPPL